MATMETKWHLRTRAVIYQEGKFLAMQAKNPTHTFLMGGHVKIGESVTSALEREVLEESGRKWGAW